MEASIAAATSAVRELRIPLRISEISFPADGASAVSFGTLSQKVLVVEMIDALASVQMRRAVDNVRVHWCCKIATQLVLQHFIVA
jgi:hypothetical protein